MDSIVKDQKKLKFQIETLVQENETLKERVGILVSHNESLEKALSDSSSELNEMKLWVQTRGREAREDKT
jgi:cell division protein FtsB